MKLLRGTVTKNIELELLRQISSDNNFLNNDDACLPRSGVVVLDSGYPG